MASDGKKPERPQWYTIREAAEYLAVGEPTLYRWMRERRITFRKVGDSTRFLQEDLDAMIQVHPSEREVAQVTRICPVCHHDELVAGRYRSTGLNYFRPRETRFWTFLDGNIDTVAYMCTRCGHVLIIGNTDKIQRVLKEPAAAAE